MHKFTTVEMVVGCLILVVIVGGVFYVRTLYLTLKKCSPASRAMRPALAWLLFVPFFNWAWNFFVVIAMSKTLAAEFKLREVPVADPHPGRTLGLAMAIAQACSIIPHVKYVSWIPTLILWAMYWDKIAKYSRMLDKAPKIAGTLENMEAV